MHPDRHDLHFVILGGVVATAILLALMYAAPLAGLPRIDMASAISSAWTAHAGQHPFLWWMGLAVFLLVGAVISPILFLYTMPALYGSAWLRGVEWGFLLWTVGGIGAMVYLGVGFYEPHTTHPLMTSLASLLGHLLYGAILGQVALRAVRHVGAHPKTA